MDDQPRADTALEQTLQQLEEDLKSLEFVSVARAGTRRLVLPNNLGWVEYRPLTGLEIELFEEKRVKSKWRQVSAREPAGEIELISDWASAFRFLFATAIVDFEIQVAPGEVVKYSNFKNQQEVADFFADLHYLLQRYIAFTILKVSGWRPPTLGA
jgi:hypothetical protein